MSESAANAEPREPASREPPSQEASRPDGDRHRLSAAGGHLLAWVGLALHNAIQLSFFRMPAGGARVRGLHHLFDLGQLLAVGALVAGVVLAWERFGPRRAVWGYAACALVAVAPSFWLVGPELTGPAQRLAESPGASTLVWIALNIGLGLSIPAAALAGRLLARPHFRFAGACLGTAGVLANFIELRGDYFGAHFYLTWASVTLAGACLRGAELPFKSIPPRITRALHATAGLFGGTILLMGPPNLIRIELFRLESSIAAPLLARLRVEMLAEVDAGAPLQIPDASAPWFQDRSNLPPVPASEPRLLPPDGLVILITIDAARADLFEGERYRTALPTLFSLRDRAIRFTQARSPAPQTYVALTTLFTGKYYSQQRWGPKSGRGSAKMWPHEDQSLRFPTLLTGAGVTTINLASEYTLLADFGVVRGFSDERHIGDTPRANAIMDRAIERLSATKGRPVFMHMHFLDAHYPYNRALTEGEPFARYVAELGLIDKEIQRLLRALSSLGLTSKTALLISSDHGEAFGEHLTWKHAVSVYDELLRVPLFMIAPGVPPRAVDDPVSLIDLGPTILDLMSLPTPGAFMGQSLAPFLRGQNPPLSRPVTADSSRLLQAMLFPGDDGLLKIIRDNRRGTVELYNLTKDPGELKNIYREDDPVSKSKLALLSAFFRAHTLREKGYHPPFGR